MPSVSSSPPSSANPLPNERSFPNDHGAFVFAVRWGPIFGLIAQIVLLSVLAATISLSGAAWAVGLAYGIVLSATLTWGRLRARQEAGFGPANWVTLSRGVLDGGVTALTVDALRGPASVAVLVVTATVALVLVARD